MNVITQKANNVQTASAVLAEVVNLNGMKADGTPVRLPLALLTIEKTELTEAMLAQLVENQNSIAEISSKLDDVEVSASNNDDLIALIGEVKAKPDYEALPLLCGQPPILFGAGTPQEAVVPTNWKQYDPVTNTGYQWNGQPSAVGQQYINTSASSGGRYIAVADANMNLTWKNF